MLAPKQVQADFSAGACPSFARHLIPENGVYAIDNGLLDTDGVVYKRGGSAALSTADFGTTGLTWVWDGYFGANRRTLFADVNDFGVLSAADAPVNLGGAGLAEPAATALLKGLLFIGGGTIYGGSRKTANYATGTFTVTNGSAQVTGVGTAWTANVDAGMMIRPVVGGRTYTVKSVDSNTVLQLTETYQGVTAAGVAQPFMPMMTAASDPYPVAPIYTVCGQRVIACKDNVWRFSAFDDPHTWNADDNWELPEGVVILGASGIDNNLTLLTTDGIWAAGNIEQDAVDFYGNPQHNLHQVTKDVLLWSRAGIANWSGNLIVPATDGVWLISGSRYEKLSKSFDKRYLDHVHSGRKTGQATVHAGHYLLPILEASGAVREVLCCRLDRPTSARGQTIYPWTTISGAAGKVTAFANRVDSSGVRDPKLIAAGANSQAPMVGRVLDETGMFSPMASNVTDHDGSVPSLVMETRDYATGPMTNSLVKAMRLGYRLLDPATYDPVLVVDYSNGQAQTTGAKWGAAKWGTDFWTTSSDAEWRQFMVSAPEDDGRTPKFFRMRFGRARSRYIRFRLRSVNASTECTIRSIELFTRKSGRL